MAYELDLDALAPKPHSVKLGGELVEVNPPKFKTLIRLMELSDKLSKVDTENTAEMAKVFSDFQEALMPIIPKLQEATVDLTIEQVMALVEFVMQISSADKKEESAPVASEEEDAKPVQ